MLLYYPNFEPPSEIWLKFALLYFDNFKTIIPRNRRHLISDGFRLIQTETDLVGIYNPDYDDGYRASLNAIDQVDKFLMNTYDRSPLFGQVNVLRKWRDPDKWTYLIFKEKFSDNWLDYCVDKGLGQQIDEGLLVSEELAFLFMTYLAKEIAFRESAAIITDNNRFDNFTNYARATKPTIDKTTKFAKGLFNLIVPKNLAEIPIGRLIDFRNRNRDLLSAFNAEIANVQDNISFGYSHQDFVDRFNNIYSEYSGEILLQGIGLASIPFAAYILLQNPGATTPEYVKEILGGLGIILAGGYSLNKALKDTKTKRYCKKYLTNLERLT